MSSWTIRKLEEFLKPYRIEHIVQDDINYRQVTISKNNGISFRGSKTGKTIGRKRQFIIDLKTNPNTLLFTRQGVLDGAIGIAPGDVDECIVTENMPMMSVDTDIIEISYLRKLLLSNYLYEKIRLLTVVGSAQKSIHERDLLNIEIKLPDIKEQKIISKKFNSLDVEHAELKTELTYQRTLIKKLRQQILQEAIEGKLTAEWRKRGDGKYEHASVLLERIIAEKNQLIKDKKIKTHKTFPSISDEDKPFALPTGWIWCRLGTPIFYADNLDIQKEMSAETIINYVDIDCIDNSKQVIKKIKKRRVAELSTRARRVLKNGFMIYSTVRPYLKNIAIVENELPQMIGTTGFNVFKPIKINIKYIFYFLLSPNLNKEYEEMMIGFNSPSISNMQFENTHLPLPPLAEQNAIVEKVEKLLALCDQLESKITENKTHAEQLMRAVLKEAFSEK